MGGLIELADTAKLNALLAERAERDGRFKRVIRWLEKEDLAGWDGPKMVGGVAWRDYVPGCEYMTAVGSPVAGTAEALLWPAPFTFLPAGFLQPGKCVRITAWGKLTTAGATPGTLTLTARYGTTTGGTSLGASAASPTFATSQTGITWHAELEMTCYTAGTAGTAVGFGKWETTPATFGTTAGLIAGLLIPSATPAAVTIDTTTAQGLLLDVTLGSASDNMTPLSLTFESVN